MGFQKAKRKTGGLAAKRRKRHKKEAMGFKEWDAVEPSFAEATEGGARPFAWLSGFRILEPIDQRLLTSSPTGEIRRDF